MTQQTTIGFIGQGFIGKHMADDFAERGYNVVRYALEPEYADNQAAIATCNIVFIAVPTPTTPDGFDVSALETVLSLVGTGNVAVIKSTILPGTTSRLQALFPDITIMHSPEFLREKQAAEDTKQPKRTIIGVTKKTDELLEKATAIQAVLPTAPYSLICSAEEAELIKYGGNTFLAMKVIYMNMLHEMSEAFGVDYAVVAGAMAADPRIGSSHMQVIDSSGHAGAIPGRGAGGHCFPKDLAALRESYEAVVQDAAGTTLLRALETKNNALLRDSQKDLDLLEGIYGSV
jgi:UDPglucose 6-dehydrogenase